MVTRLLPLSNKIEVMFWLPKAYLSMVLSEDGKVMVPLSPELRNALLPMVTRLLALSNITEVKLMHSLNESSPIFVILEGIVMLPLIFI